MSFCRSSDSMIACGASSWRTPIARRRGIFTHEIHRKNLRKSASWPRFPMTMVKPARLLRQAQSARRDQRQQSLAFEGATRLSRISGAAAVARYGVFDGAVAGRQCVISPAMRAISCAVKETIALARKPAAIRASNNLRRPHGLHCKIQSDSTPLFPPRCAPCERRKRDKNRTPARAPR